MDLTFTKSDIINGDAIKKYNDYKYNEQLTNIVNYFFNIIIVQVFRSKDTKYILKFNLYRFPDTYVSIDNKTIKIDYVPILIEKLKKTFPDSVVQSDPLKTYALIDWS